MDRFIANFEVFNRKLEELKILNKEEMLKEFIKNYSSLKEFGE